MPRKTWSEALNMQIKINNIMSNLNWLIDDYTKISTHFSKAIGKQHENINNNSAILPSDDLYNEYFLHYESLKNFGDNLINNIDEIKLKLDILITKIYDLDKQSVEFIQNVNNIKMTFSNLHSISSNVIEDNVDINNLNPQQIEFIKNLSQSRKGGRKLRNKRKNTKRNKRK